MNWLNVRDKGAKYPLTAISIRQPWWSIMVAHSGKFSQNVHAARKFRTNRHFWRKGRREGAPFPTIQLLFSQWKKVAIPAGLRENSPNLTAESLITQNEAISSSRLAVWNRSVTRRSTETITCGEQLVALWWKCAFLPSHSMPTNANFGFGGGREERRGKAIYCC